ncbi:MAG: bifunctional riboflavin kinase/FAD synthetase [Verrucomicrobiota bacterium JB023]|nr:bifunctional riboflavin kinase/FAD synthetase [Verrucomicrobiota bacterium JB023]
MPAKASLGNVPTLKTLHGTSELETIHEPLSLALGVFDGLHVGHQEVIARAVRQARDGGGIAGMLTFEPHPISVLAPDRAPRRLLASLRHKEALLTELGVDLLVVIPFSREFAEVEAEDFLADLARAPQLRSLAVGEDWNFGKGRRGNVAMMRDYCAQRGIVLDAVPPVMMDGERVSSTRIRQALRDGNLKAAEDMLGRPYSIFGQVVQGKQLGRQIGFPTANIRPENEQLPADGVWKVKMRWESEWILGIANLGRRPTVEEGGQRFLEVHLPKWSGDLYGKNVEVRFLRRIRREQRFSGVDELKAQIERDIKAAGL